MSFKIISIVVIKPLQITILLGGIGYLKRGNKESKRELNRIIVDMFSSYIIFELYKSRG